MALFYGFRSQPIFKAPIAQHICRRRISLLLLLSGWTWLLSTCQQASLAQIVPDDTLGAQSSLVETIGCTIEQIEQGSQRGSNLFHSFETFNIPEGNMAQFAPNADVERIFSRVTGPSRSSIFGTLGVIGNADLFLINPNGIVFGRNAQLNVNGSFIASTADAIAFDSNGLFSAVSPYESVLLSVNPNAFLFNTLEQSPTNLGQNSGDNPATIINRSNVPQEAIGVGFVDPDRLPIGLAVSSGHTLGLLGGQIRMNGGGLYIPDGRIELGGVGNPPSDYQVRLDTSEAAYQFRYDNTDDISSGTITLNNGALASVDGVGGGSIQLYGDTIRLQNGSFVNANSSGVLRSRSGEIVVNAHSLLRLNQGSEIVAHVNGAQVGTVIDITTDQLRIQNGGKIETIAIGGDATGGDVTVEARDIKIAGQFVQDDQEFSSSLGAVTFDESTGQGGNVVVRTATLLLEDGGRLATTVGSSGAIGGNLNIEATRSIEVNDGTIAADVGRDQLGTQGGDIEIRTRQLRIRNNGKISTNLNGSSTGEAGEISIHAEDILLEDEGRTERTGIFSQVTSGEGTAGLINIFTNTMLLTEKAQITTSNFGIGAAGDIAIEASRWIHILDEATIVAKISNNLEARRPAEINIIANHLSIVDGGSIDSSLSDGVGRTGNINITANVVEIDGGPEGRSTKIQSVIERFSEGSGIAGTIQLNGMDTLTIRNGGFISTETIGSTETREVEQGGGIEINAAIVEISGANNDIEEPFSRISTRIAKEGTAEQAGDIAIVAEELILRDGGRIIADSSGAGAGGDIFVEADRIFIVSSASLSEAGQDANEFNVSSRISTPTSQSGDGGNIDLTVGDLLLLEGGAVISANASTQGRENDALREGNGGNIDISMSEGSLVGLPTNTNSDITANAFEGSGGRITINTAGVFGFVPRTRGDLERLNVRDLNPSFIPTNDITAISQTNADLSGDIIITTQADPSRTDELPDKLVNASNAIEQTVCRATADSEFLVTGRGGLVPAPGEQFWSEDLWQDQRLIAVAEDGVDEIAEDLTADSMVGIVGTTEGAMESAIEGAIATPIHSNTSQHHQPTDASSSKRLVEAQGWQTTDNGEVILVADAGRTGSIANTPNLFPIATCHTSN